MRDSKSAIYPIHAALDSVALKSSPAHGSGGSAEVEDYSGHPLNAAIGLKNGLIAGVAFWLFAYLVFKVAGFLV